MHRSAIDRSDRIVLLARLHRYAPDCSHSVSPRLDTLAAVDPKSEGWFEGRFEREGRVGRGSYREVFRVTDRETAGIFAVNCLDSGTVDPSALDRFRREARLVAKTDSPHVVR